MELFDASIQKEDAGRRTFFEIPFHAKERFCKPEGTIYVSGTVNGVQYRGKLLSRGGGKFLMVLDKALQKAIGFDGQTMTAHITMSPEELEPAGKEQGRDTLRIRRKGGNTTHISRGGSRILKRGWLSQYESHAAAPQAGRHSGVLFYDEYIFHAGGVIQGKSKGQHLLLRQTIANYVFRKKGLITRIYAGHIARYMEILDDLPDSMVRSIQDAPICKRLVDPAACNQKCSMGYDFILKGERLQRCRNNAFMFLVEEESRPNVKSLLLHEVKAAV